MTETEAVYYQREQTIIRGGKTTITHTTLCTKCNEGISRGVAFRDAVWHRECFTCANCPVSLAGQKFISEDGKPYCFRCFGSIFAHKCASCEMPIFGVGDGFLIHMAGRHWHVTCFRCRKCRTHLLGELSVSSFDGLYCVGCDMQKAT